MTGGHTGEFMLWNGSAFNFETVMDVRIHMELSFLSSQAVFADLHNDDNRHITINYKQA